MSDQASICGEVGVSFPSDSLDAEAVYTEPCVFLFGHDEQHSWAIRELQEESRGIVPGTYRPER